MAKSKCRCRFFGRGSRTMVGVERMVGVGTARPQSLAVAGVADGNAVCRGPSHGHHMAASSRRQRRLPRLLLLPFECRTQQQIDCFSIGNLGTADVAIAGAGAVGNRSRRAGTDQAVWAEGRRGGRASQSDTGSGRSALFVRSRLGHDFPCAAASRMGSAGIAAAGDALCPQTDNPFLIDVAPVAPLASLRHQVAIGSSIGRVDRSHAERSGENGLGRHRRRPLAQSMAKRPFLRRALKTGVTIVGRLRKDAALKDLPPKRKKRGRGRPRPAFTVKWRQEQNESGQTSWTEARLGDNCLHGLWQSDHQDVQNLPGNLQSGGRDSLCQCEWGA